MNLETERLRLRRPSAHDVAAWMTFFRSERATFHGGGPQATDGTAWRAFAAFAGHWDLRAFGPLVVMRKRGGEPIGLVGPWFPAGWPERELTWSIWSPEFEGRGYAFEAARAVRDHVFADLGWKTAVSYIDPGNGRSIALAERLGCRRDADAAKPDGDDVLVYRHAPKTET